MGREGEKPHEPANGLQPASRRADPKAISQSCRETLTHSYTQMAKYSPVSYWRERKAINLNNIYL